MTERERVERVERRTGRSGSVFNRNVPLIEPIPERGTGTDRRATAAVEEREGKASVGEKSGAAALGNAGAPLPSAGATPSSLVERLAEKWITKQTQGIHVSNPSLLCERAKADARFFLRAIADEIDMDNGSCMTLVAKHLRTEADRHD